VETPYSEINLTPEQFDVFVGVIKTISIQLSNRKSGEIKFNNLIDLRWNSYGVKVEMKANKT